MDPIQLQRLVDGELDSTEVQQLLVMAKQNPEEWQRIAMGFIEDQSWQKTFFDTETAISESSETELLPSNFNVDLPEQRAPSHGPSWLAIAVAVLVATGIGVMLGQSNGYNSPSNQGSLATNGSLDGSSELSGDSNQRQSSDSLERSLVGSDSDDEMPTFQNADYYMQVPTDNPAFAGLDQANEVPIYRVKNANEWAELNRKHNRDNLSPSLIESMRGAGYRMDKNVEFVSGQNANGQQVVVPIQTIRFLPGN